MPDIATVPPPKAPSRLEETRQPSKAAVIFLHVDIIERHTDGTLACITGWMAAWDMHLVTGLGLLGVGGYVACNYPFHRGDTQPSIQLAGGRGLIGFNLTVPSDARIDPANLEFAVVVVGPDGERLVYRVRHDGRRGETRKIPVDAPDVIDPAPPFAKPDPADVSAVLERQLIGQLARDRHLVLRLDLINKCNLRCVMCHYSNEDFGKRPVQRINPDQFAAFFDPLASLTLDAVLSCGDEPLMSPHFEAIIRHIANKDPRVRIRFCTNGMLLTEKISSAIVAANVHLVMFSFDGVSGETLHRIRVGSNYERIIRNISYLKRLRFLARSSRPSFVFNFVMLESNIHEAPLFVEVARRLGADYIDFRHVVEYPFYDIRGEMLEYFKPKYNFYRERIVAAAQKAGLEVYLPPAFETSLEHDPAGDPPTGLDEFNALAAALGVDEIGHTPQGNERIELDQIRPAAHLFCDRPFTETQIREQKDVYPCPWHREKMGTLDGSTSLAEIFFGEKFQRLRLAMLDPLGAPGCQGCPIKANYLPTAFDGGLPQT